MRPCSSVSCSWWAGARKVEVDANGREVRQDEAGDIPSTPGKRIELTLDVDIQNRALEIFGDESGAAVMLDCRTGDVLCMSSAPSFDANRFVRGMTGAEYRALANYERRPLLDKAMLFPPAEARMQNCCPGHSGNINPNFDATVSDDVVDLYRRLLAH